MKRFYSLIVTILAIANVGAQSPAKILKQAESALGGRKALNAVLSVVRKGMIRRTSDGAEGKYLYQISRPDLSDQRYDIGGREFEFGFNGRSGWARSFDGLYTLTGKLVSDMQAAASYRNNLWLNAKVEKSRLTSAGSTSLNGKAVNVVVMTTAKGATVRMYFDTGTGLLLRDEVPDGDNVQVTDYEDYRNVAGVKQAFLWHLATDGSIYEIRFDEVKINTRIPRREFDFPRLLGKPLPDLSKLLADLRANEDRIEDILDKYSFTQKIVRREFSKDSNLRETGSETYQMSFHKGYRITRLVEKNGKPLTAKEQADADRDTAKRVEEIEKQIAKNEAKADAGRAEPSPDRQRRISIAEVLRASNLINPRRERFRGRDVIVFDFEPNPDYDLSNAKSMIKFFGKTAGVIWIDEGDKQVSRIEAFLADDYKVGGGLLAKLRKGASFTLDQERVNNEIWLPSQTDINMSLRVLLVKGLEVNHVVKTYDYRKFGTEVKDATVNEVKTP